MEIAKKNRLRPDVTWFAELMESALRKHDEERGSDSWKNEEVEWLFDRLIQEKEELKELLNENDWEGTANATMVKKIRKECADVANFAMFIATRIF